MVASGRLLPSDGPIVDSTVPSFAIREQHKIDNSLPIPPNTQKNLPGRQSWLGHRFRRLITFRPRPFSLDAIVSDPIFIASHQPLLKCIDFFAIQQRFADGNSVHEVCLRELVWHPYIELLFVSSLI